MSNVVKRYAKLKTSEKAIFQSSICKEILCRVQIYNLPAQMSVWDAVKEVSEQKTSDAGKKYLIFCKKILNISICS